MIELGKNIFPNLCPPAFLGNKVKKHLLLKMKRLVNIATDLLICGLLKSGILKKTQLSTAQQPPESIHEGCM